MGRNGYVAQRRSNSPSQLVVVRGRLQAMAQREISEIVGGSLARIKLRDPSPVIKVFSVGHEGDSTPTVDGRNVVLRFFRKAVRQIASKLRPGTPVYNWHANPEMEPLRTPIGEVIGTGLKVLKGIEHAIAAVWVYPEHNTLPLDVASIEAQISYRPNAKGSSGGDVTVQEVSGVALSSRTMNQPGFPGATLLATMQAFAAVSLRSEGEITEPEPDDDDGEFVVSHAKGDSIMATKSELVAAIRAEGYTVQDLFSEDAIMDHPTVKGRLQNLKEKLDEKDAAIKSLDDKAKAFEDEVKSTNARLQQTRAKEVFTTTVAPTRKLADNQKDFLVDRLTQFKSEATDETALTTELNKFVDDGLREFDRLAKLLGVEVAASTGDETADSKQEKGTSPDADTTLAGAATSEYLDPKQNPLIPDEDDSE